jgi:hypothetical protein
MNSYVNLDLVVSRYEDLKKAFNILEFRHILNPEKFAHIKDTLTINGDDFTYTKGDKNEFYTHWIYN